jgi:hypothetical protein
VFTPIEVFGVGFSIIGLLPSLACVFKFDRLILHNVVTDFASSFSSVLVYSIPYGGPVAMVWGVSYTLSWAIFSLS